MGNVCSLTISTEDTVPRCWDCISAQASYTCKLEQNLKALRVESEKLKAQRDDVNRMVDLAEQQLMKRFSQVQVWLSRVQTLVANVDELIEDGPQEIQKLCFAGCFSRNCKSSYKFGQQVAKMLKEIAELRNEGVFDKVAENEPVAQVDVRPIEPTVGLESTLGKILNLIEGNEVGIIGLHGLGGVGKTTLLTQINNNLSNMRMGYDAVIWVVVSKDQTIENVQGKISEKLGLSTVLWMNKSSDEKAIILFRILRKKKFVLLMDDLWEWVNLIKVGIPAPNQKNGCKIIFTTRFLEVCGQMGAHENIKVECLRVEEAWKLFEDKVGEETLDSHPDIRKLAKQVAAKCGGLPLAVIVVGKAMACKKMVQDWKYAIEVLKEFPYKLARMDQEVYSLLKFSYDSLPNDTMRYCFLYCSLFPEDFEIVKSFLIDYWFCEGFLDEFRNRSRVQLQGHNIINCLLNACLLEQGEGRGHVKMHDVIRDMALWIARECVASTKKFFVQVGDGSVEAVLNVGNWKGARMSLVNNGIEELRGTPACPNLQTLFLNNNKLKVISDGFFQLMPSLRVLNLSMNQNLRELPVGIFELVSLEHLDLHLTGITELPIDLKRLSNLKYLNLLATRHLRRIPRQLICNISRLQIFRISLSEGGLEEDNVLHGGNTEGLIEELKCLQHLNSLTIEIKNAFALQNLLCSHNLSGYIEALWLRGFCESKELDVLPLVNLKCLKYLVIQGCVSVEEIKMKIEREIGGGRMIQTSDFPSTPRFHILTKIVLCRCDKLRGLSWLVHAPNLTWLSVMICSKLEAIISEGTSSGVADVGIPDSKPFAKLEMLDLRDLPELKSIFWDALPFPCLRKIKVFSCSKLKKLPLNLDNAKGNHIRIEGYEEWWEKVEWDDEATHNAFLPFFTCAEWWNEIDMEDAAILYPQFLCRL